MESLESGMMRVDDIRRRDDGTSRIGGSYGLRDWTKVSENSEVTAKAYGLENRISATPPAKYTA
jgi:hypothetical protein